MKLTELNSTQLKKEGAGEETNERRREEEERNTYVLAVGRNESSRLESLMQNLGLR
jgi:hypothetical protein